MSGSNPFRRSKSIAKGESFPPLPSSNAVTHDTTTASTKIIDDHEAHPSPRHKTVRIASPPVPTSPTESISYFPKAPSIAFGVHRGSPPPESYNSASSDDSTSNPFNPDSSASDHDDVDFEVTNPTRQNAASSDRRATISGNGTSLNALDSQRANSIEPSYPSNAEGRSSGKPKTTLDVDAFTRLLLTGDAGIQLETTTSSRANFPAQQSRVDPGLASDSGSVSNEPRLGAAANTPRTSHETSTSEADEMRPASHRRSISGERKSKPPPPKTRHGKLINPDGSSSASTTRPAEALPSSSLSQQQGSPSEASVPLSSEHRSSLPLVKASPDDARTTDESSSLKRAPSQSKRPPTPPLTRRHSQIKHSKSASQDHPRQISLPPAGLGSQAPGPTSPGLRTPPRPPSRRYDKSLGIHSDTFSQPKSPLSQDPSTPWNLPQTEDSGTGVSSPPSRMPSVKRTPSGSTTSGSGMPPPPPPPRRIRASSKGSTGSAHPASVQSDREEEQGDELPRPSNAEDILADLTRLQKEVDELRGQYESRKASH
ncbi:hypothetical protein VTN77DRAFT_9200 [Rasamsonia byssochlamydoides]|uniref:uncharacterized protein n=1 Tax=Rasamsonia byssochlamydoides TaxID=89139 RepID=UPI0037428FEF